jgi:hypothetical protein
MVLSAAEVDRRAVRMSMAQCECGQVAIETRGAPIVAVACYCTSCRTAGRRFEQAGAKPVVEPDGGTPLLVYRKDRVSVVRGETMLRENRLAPESPTRRVTARCCGTPLYIEFTKGFWVSLYRSRVADAPPVAMRVMTADRESDAPLSADMPNYRSHSGKFMFRLLAPWAAMGFRKGRFPQATP